jgi:hypothetical protein
MAPRGHYPLQCSVGAQADSLSVRRDGASELAGLGRGAKKASAQQHGQDEKRKSTLVALEVCKAVGMLRPEGTGCPVR